ncbi:hypothetical protein COV16_03940 [Candidatus Woesearchaeota archaeon CG10_big_fil_rev_8_21_14_0_10_34_8]|nr:MAG: hypothetical protein COV16_03940 [Candidatus Woesearchaeota archaeon CG10_big_fil_rev_8_21_14_0_10_34_8]
MTFSSFCMRQLMQMLFPADDRKYFKLLAELSKRVAHGATVFKDFVDTYSKLPMNERTQRVADIKEMEHQVDNLANLLMKQLYKLNIMQHRKDALLASATLLMRCMDAMSVAAKRMILYKLKVADDELQQLALQANNACQEVHSLMQQLQKPKHIKKTLTRIHGLETEADYVYNLAMAKLFSKQRDARELIIMKELYDILEGIIDKANYTSLAIENMMAKED